MTTLQDKPQIVEGLKGVYFATSEASFIDGDIGKLLYRGYDIHDVAENATFEEAAYLLLYKKLPNKSALTAFDNELKANRALPGPGGGRPYRRGLRAPRRTRFQRLGLRSARGREHLGRRPWRDRCRRGDAQRPGPRRGSRGRDDHVQRHREP